MLSKLQLLVKRVHSTIANIMKRAFISLVNKVLLYQPFPQKMSCTSVPLNPKQRRKMVVGLGNPGMGSTRHSVGMAVLGALAGRLGVAEHWRFDRQVSGELVLSEQEGVQLLLLKPRLLMNINGASVAKAAEKFKIMPEDIYLVHDELDKPLGKFAMKQGGSARGHNGVRSCVDCLKTDVMPRMRIGIGRPVGKVSVEHHVLGRFSREEQELVRAVLEQSTELLLQHVAACSSKGTGAQGMTLPQGGRVTVKT
ncbi:probable peptidyl-tRNA hydrolase [Polyodon spathula]|uniref:probable peptidyl-tRNA hydrolase n=1 Tax=Polyodon spathula TaxID=7913 RepID=UPI001B7DCA05|nr:probable peptidyl-tRNA hydrolase [Polyodon spathula]